MKYFIVSDTHSFTTQLKESLSVAGFQKRNKNHTFVLLGDAFDRGSETLELYEFIMSIPKKRRILIKGNHEELYLNLLNKDYPDNYDYSNHTVDTFCHIAGYNPEMMCVDYWYMAGELDIRSCLHRTWKEIISIVKNHPITKWLQSDEWKNYYEINNLILVHSFIPLKNLDKLPAYNIVNRRFKYFPNWRTEATSNEWSDSRWGCPWDLFQRGYFDKEKEQGKTLVCGHWHTSDFRLHLSADGQCNEHSTRIYYCPGLIAIDCGVRQLRGRYYHPQNVLVVDDDGTLYDAYGLKLVPDAYYCPEVTIETTSESE